MKHTQGPWGLQQRHHGYYDVHGPQGEMIARVWDSPPEEPGQADAKLIVESPQLLADLKSACGLLRQMGLSVEQGSAVHKFETTIFRATGGGL